MNALVYFLWWLAGCGGGGSGPDTPAPVAKTHQASVSVVNNWPSVPAVDYAALLADNHLTLMEMEGFPWVDRSSLCDDAHPTNCSDEYRAKRRELLREMSAHKVTVYVNPVNFNSAFARRQTPSQFRDYIKGIAEDAVEMKADVWLGTGSEPWATPNQADAFEKAQIARQEWAGVLVMPDAASNRPTGRPYFQGIKYDFLEVHPCSMDDAIDSVAFGPPVFTVTDCGPVLNPGPEAVKSLAVFGRPLIIYDHFALQPDVEGNRAIGSIR